MNAALFLLASGQVADVATTLWFRRLGIAEANPLIRALMGLGPVWIAIKLGAVAGAAVLLRDSLWIWALVAGSWGAAVWNYRIIKRRQSQ